MNLYEVLNGYVGNGEVRVLVIAENEERAAHLASETYRRDSEQRAERLGKDAACEPNYWALERMEVNVLTGPIGPEWASDPQD